MQTLKLTILLLFLLNTYIFGQQTKQCSIEKFATINSDTVLFSQQRPNQRDTVIEQLKKSEIVEIVDLQSQPLICKFGFSKTRNVELLENVEKRRSELSYELDRLRVSYTDDYPKVKQIKMQIETLDNYISALEQDNQNIKTNDLVKVRTKRGKIGFVMSLTLSLKFKNICPKEYKCRDIAEINQLLIENANLFEKGKFEKTIEWQKRMKTVLSNIKLNNFQTLADEFTFAFNFPIASNYDADKEKYTIGILTDSFEEKIAIPILPIFSLGFSVRNSYKLIISNLELSENNRSKIENIELMMSIDRAKLIDENLRVAFAGKIVYPFLGVNKEDIWFELNKIIIFDNKTGEIYKEESQINDSNE